MLRLLRPKHVLPRSIQLSANDATHFLLRPASPRTPTQEIASAFRHLFLRQIATLKYMYHKDYIGDSISTSMSIRLPDDVARSLADLAATIERPKTYVIRKAIEEYLQEYADYLIAMERLNDKDDAIISDEQMRELLGIQD